MKIAINTCYGGYSLSKKAYEYMGIPWDGFGYAYGYGKEKDRTNAKLIECIETLKEEANGSSSTSLKVVEIPDGVEYEIYEEDGKESVHEKHRVWR